MRLGFVGLGDQGGPIADRLIAAGRDVMLWARRPDVLAPYLAAGATAAADLRMLAERCDWIGICVFDDAGVREICAAIMPHMRAGGSVVVHATVHPETCRALAAAARTHDLLFVDAPVSGGNAGARAGTLTIMAGADAAALAVTEPVVRAYAALVVRVGDPGAGQAAKLINNTLLAAHAGLAHAALEAGARLGLEHDALVAIVNASSGRSYGFELVGAIGAAGLARASAILDKDVGLLADCVAPDAPIGPHIRLARAFLDELGTHSG